MTEKVIVLCDDYEEATSIFNMFVRFLEEIQLECLIKTNSYILEVRLINGLNLFIYHFMDSHYVPSLDIETPHTILWLDNFLAELEDWRAFETGWGVREGW